MLKNIKSSYFIKLIYTFVDEEQKLKLVKYNKSIQKNLNISIINYKFFSGRYIIYESNGFGKEYNGYDDTLIFEGEYLNGQRHGKGEEYFLHGKIKFEGEYLNGKRNGKGKEYDWENGKLKFEGEYLYGKNWNGEILFEGIYLNNKRNGKGKEFYQDAKLEFEGEYLNNKEWIGNRYNDIGNINYKLNNNIKWIRKRIWL